MKAAFTLDDLPLWPNSYPPEGYTAAGIVDSIIDALDRNGLSGVYAFSNSWSILKHPEFSTILDRWVDAGHHVANHTHNHPELNDVSAEEYIEDIDLADKHLGPWLSKAPGRYFRYTLDYWGNTEEKRSKVKSHLDARGYTAAEVTTYFFEWEWNRAYENCLDTKDQDGISFLKQSFLDFSVAQLRYDMQSAKDWFGQDVCGITLGHNVPFFADIAGDLFARLIEDGLQFISLEEAVADQAYDAVCSIVSDEFLVYHQKLAHASGKPIPPVVPSFQATYEKVEVMGKGQPY